MIERYSRQKLKEIWSESARLEQFLEIELAVCRAMESVGQVPAGTADKVAKSVTGKLDPERVKAIEDVTKHDVIAFLTHVEELAGAPARFLHLGMTSSDVLDTTTALLCRRALGEILAGLDKLAGALRKQAFAHRRTVCIGRSHGIHAEPIAAGLVFARWHAELARSKGRLVNAQAAISVGKISGAVGAYTNVDPTIEARALAALGLEAETVASQVVARDRHAEFLSALAMCGAAIEQMALGVRHWQRTEVGEAEEGFGAGQKGSSAMPHKKNPILSENLTGLSRLLRAYALASFENIALWHERDISHSSVERVALVDATTLLDFMLHRAASLIENLVVHPERMRRNFEMGGGLCFSEAVLLTLVRKGLGRQNAYELVQRCALAAHQGQGDFRALLKACQDIARHLTTDEIDAAFSLEHHLQHVDVIFERAFQGGEHS